MSRTITLTEEELRTELTQACSRAVIVAAKSLHGLGSLDGEAVVLAMIDARVAGLAQTHATPPPDTEAREALAEIMQYAPADADEVYIQWERHCPCALNRIGIKREAASAHKALAKTAKERRP